MYGLVDATSFYASAEKVFDPSIRNKPVVVLTNNDGCICAACPIAERLGIPKFTPYLSMNPFYTLITFIKRLLIGMNTATKYVKLYGKKLAYLLALVLVQRQH